VPEDHFGLDLHLLPRPDLSFRFPEEPVEETADHKGPMFSPAMYDELYFPQHRRLCDYFRSIGKPVMPHIDARKLSGTREEVEEEIRGRQRGCV